MEHVLFLLTSHCVGRGDIPLDSYLIYINICAVTIFWELLDRSVDGDMDQQGSPFIKLGPLLKTRMNQRRQRGPLLMNKQKQALPGSSRSPGCNIVIPAPGMEPREPWGAGSFHLLILWV